LVRRRKSLGAKLCNDAEEEDIISQGVERNLSRKITEEGSDEKEGLDAEVEEVNNSGCDLARSDFEENSDADEMTSGEEQQQGEEVGEVVTSTSSALATKKGSGLYKPPTHEELHMLKETQNLFKSNLMKLQVGRSV